MSDCEVSAMDEYMSQPEEEESSTDELLNNLYAKISYSNIGKYQGEVKSVMKAAASRLESQQEKINNWKTMANYLSEQNATLQAKVDELEVENVEVRQMSKDYVGSIGAEIKKLEAKLYADDGFGNICGPCSDCGSKMQIVRPGKFKCPSCEDLNFHKRENENLKSRIEELEEENKTLDTIRSKFLYANKELIQWIVCQPLEAPEGFEEDIYNIGLNYCGQLQSRLRIFEGALKKIEEHISQPKCEPGSKTKKELVNIYENAVYLHFLVNEALNTKEIE